MSEDSASRPLGDSRDAIRMGAGLGSARLAAFYERNGDGPAWSGKIPGGSLQFRIVRAQPIGGIMERLIREQYRRAALTVKAFNAPTRPVPTRDTSVKP